MGHSRRQLARCCFHLDISSSFGASNALWLIAGVLFYLLARAGTGPWPRAAGAIIFLAVLAEPMKLSERI